MGIVRRVRRDGCRGTKSTSLLSETGRNMIARESMNLGGKALHSLLEIYPIRLDRPGLTSLYVTEHQQQLAT